MASEALPRIDLGRLIAMTAWLRPGILLSLITLLGAALRFYRLGAQSLWLDEVVTATAPSHRSFQDLIAWTQNDNQMPIYNAITWALAPIGHGEAFLRLPSAIAGILTIPAIYWLGRTTFGKRVGLIAALLMAVMPFAIGYSQEARPYAFLMLFSTLQLVFAYRAVRAPALLNWAGLAGTTLLNLYTHYMAIAATAGVCAFIVAVLLYRGTVAWRAKNDRRQLREWMLTSLAGLATAMVVIVGYLPWARTLRNFLRRPDQGLGVFAGAAHSVSPGDVLALLGSFDFSGLVLVMLLIGVAVCVIELIQGRWLPAMLPLICLLLPLAAIVIVLRGGIFVIYPRYLSFLFPTAVLLAAVGLEAVVFAIAGWLSGRAAWRPLPAAVTVVLIGLLLLQLSPQVVLAYETSKDDYRDAAAWIADHSPPGSTVLAMGRYSDFVVLSLGYYLAQHPGAARVVESKQIDDRVASPLNTSQGTVWGALFTSYAPTDLSRVSTAGLRVKQFPGITLVQEPTFGLPARLQAEALLRWGTRFEPELSASTSLLELLSGNRSVVQQVFTAEGHWSAGVGAQLKADIVALQPAGGTANATFTMPVTPGENYIVRFGYEYRELSGTQRVFVTAYDQAGRQLAIFPSGDGYVSGPGSESGSGAFAFMVPASGASIVVWLRASGTGEVVFGRVELDRTVLITPFQ
jgi:4-amino-4-deoxy-L-arabinose transferase-like glycosyltransferase